MERRPRHLPQHQRDHRHGRILGRHGRTPAHAARRGVNGGTPALVRQVMSDLHMARFGGLAIQWLYFICGLAAPP
ncbi:PepSY domain-containing protein [Achromobacter marplatensis]|uniref:PepSY domain-containing protein n=1 Tax=Achromobacter marplatensis TaxID=470868 RepID=UPI003D0483CA